MTNQEARKQARENGWRIETGAVCCQIRTRDGECAIWAYTHEYDSAAECAADLVETLLARLGLKVPA